MVGVSDPTRFPEAPMTVRIVPTPAGWEPKLPTPLNSEGEPFLYCMIFNADTVMAFADSATELVDLLIAGYLDIPADNLVEQAIQRTLYAVGAQVRVQADILTRANLGLATPAELEVLRGSRDTPPRLAAWECPIPLVLVDAFYQPFTSVPRPVGLPRGGGAQDSNIIWLTFSDEVEFLHGLHTAGEIQLAIYG